MKGSEWTMFRVQKKFGAAQCERALFEKKKRSTLGRRAVFFHGARDSDDPSRAGILEKMVI